MTGEWIRGLAVAVLLLLALPLAAFHFDARAAMPPQPELRSEALTADGYELNVLDNVLSNPRVSVERSGNRVSRDQSRPVDLRARWADRAAVSYVLTFTPQRKIIGSFGGVPVAGMFHGAKGEGVFTLTVDGQAFVMGTYECMRGECSIVGEEVLGHPKSFLIFTNSLIGTVSGKLHGFYPSWQIWLSRVEMWARENLEASRVQEIVDATSRPSGK
ncbi:MAG: hypothetical protein ACRDFA_07085 [bacterium]